MELILVGAAAFLAFSNGANDNFKGFATVWGSDSLSYRQALTLASLATGLGSLASLLLAETLVLRFTGKGIVPDVVASDPAFALSVAAGAAATVMIATRVGLPISTTHALIGGLVGAGLARNGGTIELGPLAGSFVLPLLASPLVAAALAAVAGRLVLRRKQAADCACLVAADGVEATNSANAVMRRAAVPELITAPDRECDRLPGKIAHVSISRTLDRAHVLSAATICFARGVNDTPKLAALLMASAAIGAQSANVLIAVTMVAGGLLFSARVARTMSRRLARFGHAPGLSANLVSAALILAASKYGLPVSTTHVSVGSIAGIGVGGRTIDWRTARTVLLSWVGTLPVAAIAAFATARLL